MSRVFNFCAGPAALPTQVLAEAQEQLLDWNGRGLSVMEMSHRSPEFVSIAAEAEQDFRDLLDIGDEYAVLFVHGGASAQFASLPLNLSAMGERVDYVDTGLWSQKAIKEAARYADVNVVVTAEQNQFTEVPEQKIWRCSDKAAYLHYTPNETINGVAFEWVPESDVPLVADMSSVILSGPIDVTRFGVIYAGAQKNIGPAGLAIVIVKKELLGKARQDIPTCMSYKVVADNHSMYNTPPTLAWYLSGLVFKWVKAQGGVAAMELVNRRKAAKLYNAIDSSDFYSNTVAVNSRSLMNVPFTLSDDRLNSLFVSQAEESGLLNLAGHRTAGGMRASIYNAVPEAAVDALVEFMSVFERDNG
ncbi:3-phosphoserine/phosphohydroxythreonine transaminase [Alkalimarinus sediminis]|uniref:Phosphoserine aminotransferase n=1 Tax=Alkalimarinus sediminis TaxID=1632866 RepID=A0A9E8KRW7_9ALTE|nr:3-phosphoserine/phosphohydroxythreonine transaminase [Alkalimarinus sediminis]UZW76672.1 3-phosphoserine/phosphohydroxythreonine transaminase [Alkalimarinus sediminis]